MAEYKLARLEEIEAFEGRASGFRPVRHHFGITTFGINASTATAAGDTVVPEHAEDEPGSSEELYVVTSGEATFELDGETRSAPAGTFVYVEAGVKRSAVARVPGTTVLAIGAAAPGEAYEVQGWEVFAPLMALFQAGDYEAAADRAQALIEQYPDSGVLFYNTACAESMSGRIDAALEHLARALALRPSLAELARTDTDLDPVRDQPGFTELVDAVST
jgi:quercetin dioxygenase-like cupin family protein